MAEQVAAGLVQGTATRGDHVFLVVSCLVICLAFVGALTYVNLLKQGQVISLVGTAIDKLVKSADERAERSIEKMEERALEARHAHDGELRLLRETIGENNRIIGRNSAVLEAAGRHWAAPKNGG